MYGRVGGVVQRVQERGDAREGFGGGEFLALVHGLLGEEFGVGDRELGPFEEDASGLIRAGLVCCDELGGVEGCRELVRVPRARVGLVVAP